MSLSNSKMAGFPEEIKSIYTQLIVNRKGDMQNSHMITEAISDFVMPNVTYSIKEGCLVANNEDANRSCMIDNNLLVTPPVVKFQGRINESTKFVNEDASILGGLTTLKTNQEKLNIPGVLASPETLAYYNAFLYRVNDKIVFDTTTPLPVSIMEIGENYLNGYLLHPRFGGGAYVEKHDKPHFHMPLSQHESGYLVLAKNDGDDWEMTAFSIPYGYAIYTPPGVWHDDGFLIGRYLVIYTVTDDYTTALLYNSSEEVMQTDVYVSAFKDNTNG